MELGEAAPATPIDGGSGTATTTFAGGGKGEQPNSYSWYRVEVTNRSTTDETKREAIRAHLVWLASKLDDDTLDHQLMTLKYELMAREDPNLADDVKARANAIQAS